MSEDAPTTAEMLEQLKSLTESVVEDAPKGIEGVKSSARRARVALNNIKKLCTPLRQAIQDAIKKG